MKFNKQITDVRITVSVFAPDGYKTVDLSLLDEAMYLVAQAEEDLVEDWSGPDHCDPYIVLAYESMADAMDGWEKDAERVRANAVVFYQECVQRAGDRAYVQAEYDKVDAQAVDIENGVRKGAPGEYKRLCDEQERLQGLIDDLAPQNA